MSDQVFWIIKGSIKPGEMDSLKDLINDMVESTYANEPDTLFYQWSLSGDEKECYICERYADSDAVITHVKNEGQHLEKLLLCIDVSEMKVFGNPNDEVKNMLYSLNAEFTTPIGGFIR